MFALIKFAIHFLNKTIKNVPLERNHSISGNYERKKADHMFEMARSIL